MRTPTKKNCFLKSISKSHIIGLYLINLEPIDKYVHTPPCSSLENYTRLRVQTKMDKGLNRFRTKTAQKPYPLGRHIPKWLI